MFSLKREIYVKDGSSGVTTKAEPTELKRPAKITNRPAPVADFDTYVALAGELEIGGILRGRILQRQVVDFLWERGVEMYAYDDVNNYLKERVKLVKDGMYRWRPLRDCDASDTWGWEHKDGGYYWENRWECRTYDKVVPFDVLQNVKALNERFPKKLHFFVSDIEYDPDPFIIVTARDMARIVFGAWDEPEFFRDGKQPR